MNAVSRSYKKSPVLKVYNKQGKLKSSKAIRVYKDTIPKGGSYKKLYPSQDIRTQYYRETLFEVFLRKDTLLHPKYSQEDLLEYFIAKNEWERFYYRK